MSNSPQTIEEAVIALKNMAGAKLTEALKMDVDKFVGSCHANIGMWIRNNWGLWAETGPLHADLKSKGFIHADDMSGVILRAFYFESKNQTFNVDEYSKECVEYWKQYN